MTMYEDHPEPEQRPPSFWRRVDDRLDVHYQKHKGFYDNLIFPTVDMLVFFALLFGVVGVCSLITKL